MNVTSFFEQLWSNYVAITPQAARIRSAFVDLGEHVVNDHVAFRTLGLEPLGMKRLEPHILALGYQHFESYEFPEKKLQAAGYVPPDPELPRIFLSELMVERLSDAASRILRDCAAQVDAARVERQDVLWAGRLWPAISVEQYEQLQAESEYAAWVASLGLRPNHFTISVNHLEKYPSIESVLEFVEQLGYPVNEAGGRVKGSPDVFLEQGSTLADRVEIEFAGGVLHEVPTCYYEFAKRYPLPDGQLFQGFVAKSADKIFESTDSQRKHSD